MPTAVFQKVMADTLIAEPAAAFKFNPSACEFVPFEAPSLLEGFCFESLTITPVSMPACGGVLETSSEKAAYGMSWCELGKPPRSGEDGPPGLKGGEKMPRRNQRSLKDPNHSESVKPRPAESGGSPIEEGKDVKQNRRRTTSNSAAVGQVATLVVKNLGLNLTQDFLWQYLTEQGVKPSDVEFHHDASGTFRGTAFVRYSSPGQAKHALDHLSCNPEVGGRKTRIELQKSKGIFGRRSVESELPQEDLELVREEIEAFLKDSTRDEVQLPSKFSVYQRKYAHSLAERHSLVHVTQESEEGEKCVFLSKSRQTEMGSSRRKCHSDIVSEASVTKSSGRKKKAQSFCAIESLHLDFDAAQLAGYPGFGPPQFQVPVSLPPGLFEPQLEDAMLKDDMPKDGSPPMGPQSLDNVSEGFLLEKSSMLLAPPGL